MITITPHPGTVAWLLTATMADADYQVRRGGISRAAFRAYAHLWRTSTFRFSGEASRFESHPRDPKVVAWIDALNERSDVTCCSITYEIGTTT